MLYHRITTNTNLHLNMTKNICSGLTGTPTLDMTEHRVNGGGICDWSLNCTTSNALP
jgi:hypothetical protein